MSLPVALITAGSAGLGAAVAKLLATQSLSIVINYSSNSQRASSLISSLESLRSSPHQKFMSVQGDAGSRPDIINLVDSTISSLGRLDVVVSNCGWTRFSNFQNLDEGMDEDDWDTAFKMNVKSHLWLMHAAKPHLEEHEGLFVTTASTAGVKPSGSSLSYAVTKAAQIHLMKSLAMITGPKIRVNSVSPGIMLTEWGLKFPQEKLDASKEKTVLKKFATVDDVAQQILCFVKCPTITGQNAIIDSGFTL